MPTLLRLQIGHRLVRATSLLALPVVVAGALGTLLSVACGGSERSDSVAGTDTSDGTDMGSTNGSGSTGATGSGGSGDTTDTSSSTSSSGSGAGGATSSNTSASGDGSGGSNGGATSSDASTSSASGGSGGSGGDVAVCDGLPANGDLCEDGAQCQIPGSPCGSIFTCTERRWQKEVVCPEDPECPAEAPSDAAGCSLTNPAAGVQVCLYDEGCGQVQADCDGTSWAVRVTPASTACSDLCEDLCTRLVECGVSWADACMSSCSTAYACPGESLGHDAAICEGRQTELSELGCSELCEVVTEEQTGERFGEDCDGL